MTALVFPGQGSQAVGMGLDLYESFPDAREVFETANAVLGFDLSRLMFEGPEEELTRTVNAQPALLVASIAALRALDSWGATVVAAVSRRRSPTGNRRLETAATIGGERRLETAATVVAGHSVGEYSALVAAGSIELAEAVRLVRRRGELMDEAGAARPGTMAAVLGLSAHEVRAAVDAAQPTGIVDVANYNSPGQIVISGEPAAVEEAGRIAKERGAKRVIPLKVSGAFHSRLMADAAETMRSELARASITDPKLPVVANVTADYVRTADEVRDALARQITGSVRWEESVQRMAQDGAESFTEVGPGNVLAGLISRIVKDADVTSIGDRASVESFCSR